jgi:hypothetical protein
MSTIITFQGVSLPVMQAVIVECSKQRGSVYTNLANGPAFAPQIHCGGSDDNGMLYTLVTPPLQSAAALAVMDAANKAGLAFAAALLTPAVPA